MRKAPILVFLIYLLAILFSFGGLINSFFQQDEWATFGNVIFATLEKQSLLKITFPLGGLHHFIPFSRLMPKLLFDFFKLNFQPYALFILFLHFINSYLVYQLSLSLTEKKLLSFGVGFLFSVNSLSRQSLLWLGASTGVLGSTIFTLLALLYFIKAHKGKLFSQKSIYLSLLFFILSLGFKETSIFLFGFLPLFWWLIAEKKTFALAKKTFLPFLVFGFIYFGLRIFISLRFPLPHGTPEEIASATPAVYFYRLLVTPLKAISQSLISTDFIINIGKIIVFLGYPQFVVDGDPNPYLAESVAADLVSFGLTVIILIIAALFFFRLKARKEENQYLSLILAFLFIILGSLLFIFIPGQAGYFSLIEGRHLYLLGFGSNLALAIFLFNFRLRSSYWFIILSLIISCLHFKIIRSDIKSISQEGQLRKSILDQIIKIYPQLPVKVVFYTEGGYPYYGMPLGEDIFPFQSGFGQTLLVWYYAHGEKLPSCFFKPEDDFLYAIDEQGYRQCQGRGFGYFRKWEELQLALEEYNLSPDAVIAFHFDPDEGILTDATDKVRKKLK